MADIVFADGIIFKLPRQGAPDFVKGSLSFKVEDAIKFLQEHNKNGWCNVNLKVSRAGKAYADLDTWEPSNSYSKGKPDVNDAYQKNAKEALKKQGFGDADDEDITF